MSVIRIASRYAKSLLDLALEKGKLETVVEDVKTFKGAASNRDLYLLLKSPIVKSSKKLEIFNQVFDGKLDPLTLGFFSLVLKKGRETYLPEIGDQFLEQYKTLNKVSSVKVTTAKELTPESLEAIKAKLLGSDITQESLEIETDVDPELIGGFVVQVGDKLIDASVAHRLREMAKVIAE